MMFLTEDQKSIQQLAKDFAEAEIRPVAKALESDKQILWKVWEKMAALGLTGLQFPEQYGGMDTDTLSYLLVIEELAKVSASVAVTLSVHTTVGILPIYNYGTEEQKQKYLPDLISGAKMAAFGLTEPNAGSDAGNGLTKAEPVNGHYVLNGNKLFITNAHLADIFVLTARTDREQAGNRGLSAFVLEKGAPGFTVEEGDEKLGIQGSDWGVLVFEDVKLEKDQLLGQPEHGFKIFMNSLDAGRMSIGAMSLGIAEAALADSLKYSKERKQFDKPISDFQAIQFKLADMAVETEAARHLVYHAARLKDAGKPFATEASMAKLWASEACMRAADQAVQIHGGYGYTKDFSVERYFRDAKCTELVEGTSQIQRLVIARHLLNN
jgi:alkylation response protein AidB-like acyl-CoA dehydrogenase